MDNPAEQISKYRSLRKRFLLAVLLLFLTHSFAFSKPAEIPVRVIKELPLPKWYHEGLFLSGRYIWVNNGRGGMTWVVDPGEGTVVSTVKPVGTFTEGMTSAGDGTYWVTDWDNEKLHRVNIEKNRMVSVFEVSLSPEKPAGVVLTERSLYVITWLRGMGTKYYLRRFDREGRFLEKTRIKGIPEPSQVAWDGKFLWITSWYNQRVYKVDADTYDVLGYFKSPAPKSTGIAWDGEYFWITGTYAGLYQVEIAE